MNSEYRPFEDQNGSENSNGSGIFEARGAEVKDLIDKGFGDASIPVSDNFPEYGNLDDLIDDFAPYCTGNTYILGVDIGELSDEKGALKEESVEKGEVLVEDLTEILEEKDSSYSSNGWRVLFKYDGSINDIRNYIENKPLVLEEINRIDE